MQTRAERIRSRTIRSAVAAAIGTCVLVLLPSLSPAAVTPTATTTKLMIKAQQGGFFGYVQSRNSACEVGRKVTLYALAGRTRNLKRDRKIGTDTAQPNGPDSMWSVNTERPGRFYAHIKASGSCAAAFSATVRAQV